MTSFLPEFFLVNAILFLGIYGSHILTIYPNQKIQSSFQNLTILVLLWTGLLTWTSLYASENWLYNEWTAMVKLFLIFTCGSSFILGQSYIKKHQINNFEYYLLCLLAVVGICLMLSSYDLLGLYLGIELQSLSLYVLANFQRNSVFSTEAGLKYFLIGAISSGLFVLGSSILYGCTGSIVFQSIGQFCSTTNIEVVYLGLFLILFALLLKLGAAPFHMWTLDVYEGAPTSVSMILVSLPKIGLLTVLFKFLYIAFFFQLEVWTPVLLCIGLFSILIGGLGGSRQKSLKRLLVYSGIGHIGYILLGILGGISVRGCYASLFYLFIYILSNLFLWSIYLQWTSTQEQANGSLSSMKDLSLTNSSLSIGTALIWFSLAGVPPLAGFFAKYFVISPAIQEHLYVFALGFLFLSLVSVTYYLKIVKILYFDGANTGHWKKREFALEIPHITGWLLAGILSIIFFFCLNPNLGFLTMYILGLNLFPA